MKIHLTSVKQGEQIHNNHYAHELHTKDKTILTIHDIDEKYTPVPVEGFGPWQHAVAINGKAAYFCETPLSNKVDIESFTDFVTDHVNHFNAIPCEYAEFDDESEEKFVLDTAEVWKIAEELDLLKLVKQEAS